MLPSTDFSFHWHRCIPVNIQISSDWLTSNCGNVETPIKRQLHTVAIIISRTGKLADAHSISTGSYLCCPQNIPHLFIIIFLCSVTGGNHGCTITWARWGQIRVEPTSSCFSQCASHWDTTILQTPLSPPWCCQCHHWIYDPAHTLENCPWILRQKEYEAACHQMWVNPYYRRWPSTSYMIYRWCT